MVYSMSYSMFHDIDNFLYVICYLLDICTFVGDACDFFKFVGDSPLHAVDFYCSYQQSSKCSLLKTSKIKKVLSFVTAILWKEFLIKKQFYWN